MTKLPKSYVAHSTSGACALRIDNDYSISNSIDPVELVISHNLSENLEYTRVDPQSAWQDFMKKVS